MNRLEPFEDYELLGADIIIIQHWEGWISGVSNDGETFWARLVTVEGEDHGEMEAEIPSEYLFQEKPEEGYYIDWHIGYAGGLPFSLLKMRHYPPLTAEEIAEVERKADELEELFRVWDEESKNEF